MGTLSKLLLSSLFVCLFQLTSVALADQPVNGPKTPLDEYIAKVDPAYQWQVVKTIPGEGYTTFVVDLKSQTWRAQPQVDRTLWQHWLVIVKPHTVAHETGYVLIGGGANGGAPPNQPDPMLVKFAKATNTVAAELKMIPNQPLIFNQDGKPRKEDDLIAYCWIKFMETHDATWLPRLPMVKSVVRAMDTVTALLASDQGGKTAVSKFIVAGGSKRGWTTWLTGAADSRVVAIMPLVIDVVNVKACMNNHFCAFGFWAPAVGDYTHHGINERRDTPAYAELLRIVDPYYYRNRLTMPKYIVNAAGDQYFPPDSSKFYFGDLVGPKYLRYVPNVAHNLRGSDAVDSLLGFYDAVLTKRPLPSFTWKFLTDGGIEVHAADKPREVKLWQATNPKARDFRLESIGTAYKSTPLNEQTLETYVARVPAPETGWTAYFVELTYDNGGKPIKFTTQVGIVPDVLPHRIEEAKKVDSQ